MIRRCRALGAGVFALALQVPAALAAIPFEVRDVTANLWQWPAAVGQDIGIGEGFAGVIHYDQATHAVRHSWTFGGATFYSDSILLGGNPGRIAATTDRWDDAIYACFYLELTGTGHLYYATKIFGGEWTVEPVDAGLHVGELCGIGHRTDIGPVIVYIDRSDPAEGNLMYADKTLGFWRHQPVESSPWYNAAASPSIATNRVDATHVAWLSHEHDQVRYSQVTVGAVENVAPSGGVGSVVVAVDRNGVPHIAYTQNGALLIATKVGGAWQSVTVLPASHDVRDFSFVYGHENQPYVAFTTGDTEQPLQIATPVFGQWRVQPIGTDPAFAAGQVPSIWAASGIYPPTHLHVAWNGFGLKLAWDNPNARAFARARLLACPDSDAVSTVRIATTTRYLLESGPVVLDFLNGAVWDSVRRCGDYNYLTTLTAGIGPDTNATYRIDATGTVTGGVSVTYGTMYGELVEPSVPVAGVDQDGDGLVTPADRDLLASRFGTFDPRSDLDFDGDVDDGDRQVLIAHMWHGCTAVGVGPDASHGGSRGFSLSLEPNPSRGATRLAFSLPRASAVRVEIRDVAARRVRTLDAGEFTAGAHEILWDGRDDDGRALPSGVYFVRLRAGERVALGRLVRMK